MSDSQHYDDSLKRLEEEFEKVKDGMDTVSDRLGHLSEEVGRTTAQHDRLSAEHSALTSRVNHIDLRISVMEETTRLQNKHNEEIHRDFKDGLQRMETNVGELMKRVDKNHEEVSKGIRAVREQAVKHAQDDLVMQRRILLYAAVVAGSALVGVLGYFGKWIFLNVVGG